MADAAYDVVIVGGGTKALATASYLTKYGGMEVAIFERRHELGGGLCSSEAAAPGFTGDPHATWMVRVPYYEPMQQDFPDFEEKGGRFNNYKGAVGMINRDDQKCLVVYATDVDPTQEKTAREIARFAGEKDAETYLKVWDYARKPENDLVLASQEDAFNLLRPGEMSPLERWWDNFLKWPDCPVDQEILISPAYKVITQLFDSRALCFGYLRMVLAGGFPPTPLGSGATALLYPFLMPYSTSARGGTHSMAHAYIRIFLENGGKFFTHSHVDKIIIENGAAKGIRLHDGTEIEARKLVLANLDPTQLCLQLIGREHFSQRIIKKVESLEGDTNTITWYTWALREAPRFKAADFNSDINETGFITLNSGDLDFFPREAAMRRVGINPPIENSIVHHQYGDDKSRAPEGRKTCLTEQYVTSADRLSEKEWLQFKKTHAEDVVREWEVYCTNMGWDNIIGYDPITPYDTAGRLINMAPWGDMGLYNFEPNRPRAMQPLLEFAQHRIGDIKNLYGTASNWCGSGGSCSEGYRAYKAIAEDFGLSKPWEEKGRPW